MSEYAEPNVPRGLIALMAVACGLSVAGLYYAQPLAGPIGRSLGLGRGAVGLTVTLAQLGYVAGLILIVPLGDLMENRRLIVLTVLGGAAALVLAALAPDAPVFLLASLLVGLGSVAAQMLVPVAAHLAPPAERGRVVGEVMSGLLAGILLSRPVASLIYVALGWRAVFAGAAAAMLVLAGVLDRRLPRRRPGHGGPDGGAWAKPQLRRRRTRARPPSAPGAERRRRLGRGTDKLVGQVRADGDSHVTAVHVATDHSWSDARIRLETEVISWLATLPAPSDMPRAAK